MNQKIKKFIRAERFFKFTLALAALQGLWYAISYKAIFYDESVHFGFIGQYASKWSPFISSQDPSMDYLGEITRNPNYLFYYIMSFPMKVIKLFTDSQELQLVLLRLLMILCFVAGLILWRRLLLKTPVSRIAIHLGLFLFILIPIYAPTPGVINYDNVIFAMTPLVLLLCVEALRTKKLNLVLYWKILVLGLLLSLVKFTFLALFGPILLYIAYDFIKKYKGTKKEDLKLQVKKIGPAKAVVLALLLLLSIGLFVERPIMNLIEYKKIDPPCQKIITRERCMSNYTSLRNIKFIEKKPANFKPYTPFEYLFVYWGPSMVNTSIKIGPTPNPYPFMYSLYYIFALTGIVVLLISLREILANRIMKFLLIISLVYSAILFVDIYMAYTKYGQPVAISARYLLPIMPILIAFSIHYFIKYVRLNKNIRLSILFLSLLVIATQAGGLGRAVVETDKTFYLNNSPVKQINPRLEAQYKKLIIERFYFNHY